MNSMVGIDKTIYNKAPNFKFIRNTPKDFRGASI